MALQHILEHLKRHNRPPEMPPRISDKNQTDDARSTTWPVEKRNDPQSEKSELKLWA